MISFRYSYSTSTFSKSISVVCCVEESPTGYSKFRRQKMSIKFKKDKDILDVTLGGFMHFNVKTAQTGLMSHYPEYQVSMEPSSVYRTFSPHGRTCLFCFPCCQGYCSWLDKICCGWLIISLSMIAIELILNYSLFCLARIIKFF